MSDKNKNNSEDNSDKNQHIEDAEVVDPHAGTLARAAQRARSLARSIRRNPDVEMQANRARSLLQRVASRASDAIKQLPVDTASEKLVLALSDPRTVQVVQRVMKAAGSASIQAGFRKEPQARLLFEFAEWCEAQTDRGDVMALLLQDAFTKDGAFAQLSKPMMELGVEDPLRAFLATPPTESLIAVFHSAQQGLILTLCRLAALGLHEEPPAPETPRAEQVAWFRASAIPERFKGLMALALGEEAPPEPRADAPETAAEAEAAPGEGAGGGGVASAALERIRSALPVRSFPPGFRFLVGTYLVFLHTYLSRNMVDAFPKVMEQVREEVGKEQDARDLRERAARGEVLEMDPKPEGEGSDDLG